MRSLLALALTLQARLQITLVRLRAALLLPAPGQGLVEYGLILVLIAVTCIGILAVVGQQVSGAWYGRIYDSFEDILNG